MFRRLLFKDLRISKEETLHHVEQWSCVCWSMVWSSWCDDASKAFGSSVEDDVVDTRIKWKMSSGTSSSEDSRGLGWIYMYACVFDYSIGRVA